MRYPGGKGKCYQHIINLMPPHRIYIESHLGGGAVIRHKKAAERNIGLEIDPSVVKKWRAEKFDFCELIEVDAVSYLSNFDFDGSELIYADPPYVSSTRRRNRVYKFDYDDEQHKRLLALLKKLPCKVMISGYDNPLYRRELQGWREISFPAKTHVGVQTETVWLNFEQTTTLHDCRYIGDTFRDRQTVRRRQDRMQQKIERMSEVERNELIRWLNMNYGAPK